MILEVTTQKQLDALEQKEKTVLYFSAPWCGPCQNVKPAIQTLSEHHPDVNFVRIDVDEAGDLAKAHSVRGIPTVIVLNSDGTSKRLSGVHIIGDLTQYL